MTERTRVLPLVDADVAARIPPAPPGVRPSPEQIVELAAFIAERFHPERIVLFGSRAYGRSTPDSDVDLMVIMDVPGRPVEQAVLIRQALVHDFQFAIDILVRTPARIALGLAEGDFFLTDVMTKGITLFASPTMTQANGSSSGGEAADQTPGLKQATREWLDKAESDYRAAVHLLAAPDPEFNIVCFHAQQCAEKYLKALLQEREVASPRTHDLEVLARLSRPVLPAVAPPDADLAWLSSYAVDIRYPGANAGQAEAERAIALAGDVRALVRGALGLAS